ncbi:MAG: VacJ family lipoprotein [Pseudomonadota bacterium]|nr:VacJ family lipoprotein [Pseudomonadota bacterium]
MTGVERQPGETAPGPAFPARMPGSRVTRRLWACLLPPLVLLAGCSTSPKSGPVYDPWENFNRDVYKFNRELDRVILKPVADGYVKITPHSVRKSVGNFFTNMTGPNVVLNDLLQGKPGQGFEDTMRFVFNSTFGIGGLFDVATEKGLIQHEEDFGQTLGVWGFPPGPYLMVPLFGPFTTRELPGAAVSYFTYPLFLVDDPRITLPLAGLGFVDLRARSEAALQFVDEAAVDPYVFTREAYLQRRQFLVYDGNPPVEDFFDELEDLDEEWLDGPDPQLESLE